MPVPDDAFKDTTVDTEKSTRIYQCIPWFFLRTVPSVTKGRSLASPSAGRTEIYAGNGV